MNSQFIAAVHCSSFEEKQKVAELWREMGYEAWEYGDKTHPITYADITGEDWCYLDDFNVACVCAFLGSDSPSEIQDAMEDFDIDKYEFVGDAVDYLKMFSDGACNYPVFEIDDYL